MRILIRDKNKFMNIFNSIYPNHKIEKINGVSIDSRNIFSNDIFFPLKGKKFDGHDFLKSIILNKTITCFSENKINANSKIIKSKSIKNEIFKLATIWRKKTNAKIIAITGSNGKTTLKELLFHILKNKYNCSKSLGNFNSTIGLPLSFLNTKLNDDFCILELGASCPNEIKILCNLIQPDFTIITNISNAHIANFNSFRELVKTKIAIFNNMNKNGKAFINLNDKNISKLKINNKITFGFNISNADYNTKILNKQKKIYLKINNKLLEIPNHLTHLSELIIEAYSIANHLKINDDLIQKSLKSFKLPNGRGKMIKYKNCNIIDDSYNSNPSSVRLGLTRLSEMKNFKRKIVIIGDMLELGKDAANEHRKIGKYINQINIDLVITYGRLMYETHNQLNKNKMEILHYFDIQKLCKKFNQIIKSGDIVYIKGSRSMNLEKIFN